jgi:hypothetical protein
MGRLERSQLTDVGNMVVLTQEGDPRDLLLVAGESFDVSSDTHLYVQAERDAVLQFASASGFWHDHARIDP